MNQDEVMEAFGDKAFLLLQMDNDLVGLAGWQVENLVARTTDLLLDQKAAADKALPLMIKEVERASSDLQCEASLVFHPLTWSASMPFGNIGLRTPLPGGSRRASLGGRRARIDAQRFGALLQATAHRPGSPPHIGKSLRKYFNRVHAYHSRKKTSEV